MTKNKTTTLVVHPIDSTTNFLSELYREKDDALVVRGDIGTERLREMITDLNPETVYMLGHGLPQGLIGHGRVIIDESFVSILRDRDLVAVWCNADCFFREHKLTGFFTGMIVSEPQEARIFNLDDRSGPIEESNARLVKAIVAGLRARDEGRTPPETVADEIRNLYLNRYGGPPFRVAADDSVMGFNAKRIYYMRQTGLATHAVDLEFEGECVMS